MWTSLRPGHCPPWKSVPSTDRTESLVGLTAYLVVVAKKKPWLCLYWNRSQSLYLLSYPSCKYDHDNYNLFICGLINDAVSSSNYVASDSRMIDAQLQDVEGSSRVVI
jgi:hypothetical protein